MERESVNLENMTHEFAVSRAWAKRRELGEVLRREVELEVKVDLVVDPALKKVEKAVGDELKCVVCLSKKKGNEDNVMAIECGHKYHGHCIVKWFKKHDTCPICRHEIKIDRRFGFFKQ